MRQAAERNDDVIDDGILVKILLKKILTKTNRDFRGLCEGLESEGQGFLVKNCLSQEGMYIKPKSVYLSLHNHRSIFPSFHKGQGHKLD